MEWKKKERKKLKADSLLKLRMEDMKRVIDSNAEPKDKIVQIKKLIQRCYG